MSARVLAAACLLFAGCEAATPNSSNPQSGCAGTKCDGAGDDGATPVGEEGALQPVDYCVGIRGNGQLITGHFGALSRLIEKYGIPSGVSGGSSGSVTAFLLESIKISPAVQNCGEAPCSAAERSARAALMFKSLQGYLDVLKNTPEVAAVMSLAPLVEEIQARDLEGLAETDPQQAIAALRTLLESSNLRDLVNRELFDMLRNSPDPAFHLRGLAQAASAASNFSPDDPAILVRPGLVDFAAFAEKIGRIGSFYAGYGNYDADGFEAFMQACASAGMGLTWTEVASLPAADGSTCGATFEALATTWRDDFIANESDSSSRYPSRIDDSVGAELPALISTSLITGPSVDRFLAAKDNYFAAQEFELGVSFDDVRFGYFGQAADLQTVETALATFDDEKSQRFASLGPATWRKVLSYSPAEPGLTRALELPVDAGGNQLISAGGWSDLHPTLVLRGLGCENVVYITRRGGELGGFADSIGTLLGLQDDTRTRLYDLEQDSSIARSLEASDGVWCTDWMNVPPLDIAAVSNDGYNAPFITDDPDFASDYANLDPTARAEGCTVNR